MDISLMRLHITRSAINQIGKRAKGEGVAQETATKTKNGALAGQRWQRQRQRLRRRRRLSKIKSKCHKIPQCWPREQPAAGPAAAAGAGPLPALSLPSACVAKQQMNYMQLIERKFAKYFRVSAPHAECACVCGRL